MDSKLVENLLGRFDHRPLHLAPALRHRLLDAAWVDPAVLDEPLERDPGDLPPNGVEAREHDCLGGVVNDDVDPGGLLEGADVASLAADDTTLHLIGGELHDGDSRRRSLFGRHALNRKPQDLLRLALRVALRLFLDLSQVVGGLGPGFVLQIFDELMLGFVRRCPCESLKFRANFGPRAAHLLALLGQLRRSLVELPGTRLVKGLFLVKSLEPSALRLGARQQALLGAVDAQPLSLLLLLPRLSEPEGFLPAFELLGGTQALRLFVGARQDTGGFVLRSRTCLPPTRLLHQAPSQRNRRLPGARL